MPYPLAVLPTTPLDLEAMHPCHALPHTMAFMKNTLLVGLNNIDARARRMNPKDAHLTAFLTYIAGLCDILAVHVKADERFFRQRLQKGTSLYDLLGPGCLPDLVAVLERAKILKETVSGYLKSPQRYDGGKVVALLNFGDELQKKMEMQISAINVRAVARTVPPDEMAAALKAIVEWFASQSDIAFLVPYIHSHHNRATSQYWPPMTREGWQALPMIVKHYASCWEFAPFQITFDRKHGGRG